MAVAVDAIVIDLVVAVVTCLIAVDTGSVAEGNSVVTEGLMMVAALPGVVTEVLMMVALTGVVTEGLMMAALTGVVTEGLMMAALTRLTRVFGTILITTSESAHFSRLVGGDMCVIITSSSSLWR